MNKTNERRNSPGKGTIYHRADGRWMATYSVGDGTRKSLYAATQREADKRMQLALREQAAGLPPSNDRLTVAGYLNRWLEEVARPSVRPEDLPRLSRCCPRPPGV